MVILPRNKKPREGDKESNKVEKNVKYSRNKPSNCSQIHPTLEVFVKSTLDQGQLSLTWYKDGEHEKTFRGGRTVTTELCPRDPVFLNTTRHDLYQNKVLRTVLMSLSIKFKISLCQIFFKYFSELGQKKIGNFYCSSPNLK